jgi:hypothetical protein
MAMMAMTTNNSIKVKPRRAHVFIVWKTPENRFGFKLFYAGVQSYTSAGRQNATIIFHPSCRRRRADALAK